MRINFDTRASSEQVRRALTDFTERRLQIWHRTLDPKTYEVRDSGDTWAVAKESSRGSPFWVVCHYDWSNSDIVRWTITESSYRGARRYDTMQSWLHRHANVRLESDHS